MASPLNPAGGLRDPHYRADVDGLRAFAVASVVFYHAGAPFLTSGYVGVDVFFVISGYLIGGIILRETAEHRFTFLKFYARRARRILPALFVVTAAVCAISVLIMDSVDLKNLGGSAASALAAVSNVKFWLNTGYFDPISLNDPMLMTWSLGVEEQFYLVFPFILLALARAGETTRLAVLVALTLASFAISQVLMSTDPRAAFYLLPARAWELGVGALLALWHRRGVPARRPRWREETQGAAGAAMLAASVVVFTSHTPFPGWAALLPVAGTALLIDSPNSIVNRRLLSWGPVVFVGLISYSWYLWHWPLMTLVRLAVPDQPTLGALLIAAALAFALAWATWRWVEQPFRKRILPAPSILARYAAAGLVLLAAPLALRQSEGWPQRLPPAVAAIEAAREEDKTCLLALGDGVLPTSGPCVPGPAGTPAFALLGDSHAHALGPGLEEIAADNGARLLYFTKAACAPLLGVGLRMEIRLSQPEECMAYMEEALDRIAADDDIDLVFVSGRWSMGQIEEARYFVDNSRPARRLDPQAALRRGLPPLLDRLEAAGKQVVVLADVPNMTFDVMNYQMSLAIPLRRALMELAGAPRGVTEETASLARMASRTPLSNGWVRELVEGRGSSQVSYVDVTDRFCDAAQCRFRKNGVLLYSDNAHLTDAGAINAVSKLRRQFHDLFSTSPPAHAADAG